MNYAKIYIRSTSRHLAERPSWIKLSFPRQLGGRLLPPSIWVLLCVSLSYTHFSIKNARLQSVLSQIPTGTCVRSFQPALLYTDQNQKVKVMSKTVPDYSLSAAPGDASYRQRYNSQHACHELCTRFSYKNNLRNIL